MRLRFLNDPAPPPLEWYAANRIPKRSLTVVNGAEGGGKTTLISNMIAAGLERGNCLGMEISGEAALWIAAEAATSTERRLRALVDQNAPLGILTEPPNLTETDAENALLNAIDATARKFGREVEVVVVDSLTSATRGADENSGKDMGKAMGVLLALVEKRNVTVILLAHTGKGGGKLTRGHSVVGGDADAVLNISGEAQKRLETVKQRDAEAAPKIAFRLVHDGRSLRVELDGRANQGHQGSGQRLSPDAQIALTVIREMAVTGLSVALNDWRDETVKRYGNRELGALRTAFSKSKKALIDRGFVEIENDSVTVTEALPSVTNHAAGNEERYQDRYRGGPFRAPAGNGNASRPVDEAAS